MAKSKKGINKDNIALVTSVIALIVGVASFSYAAFIWDNFRYSNDTYGEQIFELTKQNAIQNICIEKGIKPCTSDAINKATEAQD